MSKQNDALVKILPDIKRAAQHIALEWADVVEAEDVAHDITVILLEWPNVLAQVSQLGQRQRRQYLFQVAQQVASKERVDYEHFTGNFRYSTREVREILERGALYEKRTRTDTERLDLDEGVALLRKRNPRYAELIGRRYLQGEGMFGSTERKELTRAVDLLTNCMNNVHRNRRAEYTEGPGTRKIISREDAAWIAKHQYEGYGRSRGTVDQAIIERTGF